ncbi:MAG: glycine zipper family protein [Deltaproteobacteria bacterium]|nr:glycine zipper family protein [Deltaproteobacteria bacterium]
MKRIRLITILVILSALCVSCAHYPPDRYNTQTGALIGAGTGALIGQAIGHNTAGTLIGLAAGTILGGLVGNAVDQDYDAARDAARNDKPVVYYDRSGSAVEAVPGAVNEKTNCRRVTKRNWQDGKLVSETVEEICRDPEVTVIERPTYVYPAYPRVYYYYGARPYYHHRHRPYRYYW